METNKKNYNFSLFKPISPYGKQNRNLIISLVAIWFIAIFGFQILLLSLQKPTPEKSLLKFESVWNNVKNGTASEIEKQDFVKSIISVEGKSSLKKDKKPVLDNAISWMVYTMISDSEKVVLSSYVADLKDTKEKLTKANDQDFLNLQANLTMAKSNINTLLDNKIGIESTDVEAGILPYCINTEYRDMSEEDIATLPQIMSLYLTHNRSFLTDTKFLGFPFHYFYTAVFLLILFVILCLIYSFRIQQIQKKYSIIEE
ncbi:MAG TPA: DUF4212 domain-containing protein [Bacteroidales bacterium]|nr:DUF4212 domain-containing protein [Bacteroidales bacterium]